METYTALSTLFSGIHSRTPEDALLKPGNYVMVGAGGVGMWLATLILMHMDNNAEYTLMVVDPDKIDTVNMNRYPVPWSYIGRYKVEFLADLVFNTRPNVKYVGVATRITGFDSLLELVGRELDKYSPTVYIDATDSPAASEYVRQAARASAAPYLGVHYDGWSITVEWEPPRYGADDVWSLEDGHTGYQVFPSLAVAPYLASAIAVLLLLTRPGDKVLVRLRDLRRDALA